MPSEHDLRSFSQFITTLEDGDLHSELTEKLPQLIADLHNHMLENGGKPKGKIDISINLKLDNGTVDVDATYKISAPKPVRRKTVLWATADNMLTRANPRQQELNLKAVTPASAGTKAV